MKKRKGTNACIAFAPYTLLYIVLYAPVNSGNTQWITPIRLSKAVLTRCHSKRG